MSLVVAFFAASCGSGSDTGADGDAGAPTGTDPAVTITVPASGAVKPGGLLSYGLDAETDGWNPTKSRWAASGTQVGLALFDPLTAYGKDVVAHPYLAEALTPNATFTEWTLTLRPNVKFHDGSTLAADVVKQIFEAHKASTLTAAAVAAIDTITVANERTVLFKMKQAWATFPSTLTGQLGVVPAPAMLADANGGRNPVGTGPFKLKSWVPDKELRTVKNPNYWRTDEQGTQLPYLDGVDFKPITDTQSRVKALLTKDVDMMATAIPAPVKQLLDAAKAGEIQLVENSGEVEESFIQLNLAKRPFDNPLARQALAYGTDTKALVDTVFEGMGVPATDVFRPGTPYHSDVPYPEYDPDKARQLVEQYKAQTGGDLSFTLTTGAIPFVVQEAQFLQAAWAAIGINVQIEQKEQSRLILDVVTGQYQATTWSQFGAPDPDFDYQWWSSQNAAPVGQLGLNMARNKDLEIDKALDSARATTNPAVRKQQYAILSKRLNEDLPYIWLGRLRFVIGASNNVRGVLQGPLPDGSPSYPLGGPGGFAVVTRLTQTWLDR